ncbi:TPT-domain-containing protein, partial [Aureobasidium melanogenum]
MASVSEKQPQLSMDESEFSDYHEDQQRQKLLSDDADVEKQAIVEEQTQAKSAQEGAEYLVSTRVKMICLGLYFAMNLGLTLYNKAVLDKFAFPWLMTTLHATCAAVGCYALLLAGHIKLSYLTRQDNYVLVAFSVLFTINIAISNVSLEMVSVPFHQIARSTCPVATILIYRWFYGRSYAKATYMALIPIVLGVGLSTYGDYYFSLMGASLTFLGVFLAAIKVG